jgi:hypothetical protein
LTTQLALESSKSGSRLEIKASPDWMGFVSFNPEQEKEVWEISGATNPSILSILQCKFSPDEWSPRIAVSSAPIQLLLLMQYMH